jgi:hypothetical protein
MLRIHPFSTLHRLLPLAICISTLGISIAAEGAEASSSSRSLTNTPKEQVLFPFDDVAIPFNKGLLMTLVHGKKAVENPVVLPAGKPGEPDYPKAQYYGTVIRVGDEYRMWYSGVNDSTRCICYATSTNGLAWEKPKLGLVEFKGSTQNNILSLNGTNMLDGAIALVLYEPDDPNPERRFKMLREIGPAEMPAAFSADGLRWKSAPATPPGAGIIKDSALEACGLMKFNGCYYVNGHGGTIPHPLKGAGKRMSVTFISYDFEHWTQAAHLAFRRDPIPPRPPTDFEFHRGEQVHVGASLWNRGNVVLGFYGQYHNPSNDRRTSTIDIGLIVSSDGLHFTEPVPDFKLIESFEEADGADARLLQGEGFENIANQTVYWYSIWATTPGSPNGVRVATWPRDRFGYFSAAPYEEHACCISSPFKLETGEGEVRLNVDRLSPECRLRVELLSEQMVPLPEYSGENCISVTKTGFSRKVAWKGKNHLENISGSFRIKVSWEGGKPEEGRLYAIYLQENAAHK